MFASFEPEPADRLPRANAEIVPGTGADLDAMVALAVVHRGADPVARRDAFARRLAEADGSPGAPVVRVARVQGVVVGYGIASRIDPPEGDYVPAGWYLVGGLVHPAWRRRGIGAALVDARLAALGDRTDTVRAFTAVVNEASQALLCARGFGVEADDPRVPGVTFTGGRGVLLRRDLGAR